MNHRENVGQKFKFTKSSFIRKAKAVPYATDLRIFAMAKTMPCFQRETRNAKHETFVFNRKHETRNPCFKPETCNTKPATLCFNTKHLIPRRICCGKTGFTLVEIVVSITMLAIVFLSLYQFFFKSYYFSKNVCAKEVALLLARKKAEHTLAGIEAEDDTVTIDTLDGIIYKTVLTSNEEIPASCSIKVYVNKEEILLIQMLKP